MRNLNLTPGSIVVGVDGSDPAIRAVELAATEADLRGLPLTVVRVTRERDRRVRSWSEYYGIVPGPDPEPELGTTVTDAMAVARHRHPGLEVTGHSVDGDPSNVLADASRTAELLVVGSRGRGPVRSAALGSVSASVAYQAQCTTIVSRPTRPGAVTDGVVVAADLTPESQPVVNFAFQQASLQKLPLTVVHSTADEPAPEIVATVAEEDHLRKLLATSVADARAHFPDVLVTLKIVRAHLDEWLTDGTPRPWHLIVVGRHVDEHGVMRRLAGAHAMAVLERADGPVAIVPQAGVRPRGFADTVAASGGEQART